VAIAGIAPDGYEQLPCGVGAAPGQATRVKGQVYKRAGVCRSVEPASRGLEEVLQFDHLHTLTDV
jgi:hypothetical protein